MKILCNILTLTYLERHHCSRRKEKKMKKNTHPAYHRCKVTCVSCGATFETGSTEKEIRVDTCSNCHPFYTGKQRYVQADGRIDRFNRKYGLNEKK